MRVAGFLSKALRFTGWTLGGLLGLLILCYLVLLAINWRDRPPSAEALRMKALIDERPPIADADNGYLHLLGLSGPSEMDALQAGVKRRDWMVALNRDPGKFGQLTEVKDSEPAEEDNRLLQEFREHCRGDAQGCETLLDGFAEEPRFSAFEQRLLSRYREMLKHRAWHETIPLDLRVPLPAYSSVMNGQALHFRDLRSRVKPGSASDIRASLEADLEFWREVQKSSSLLITKMIAVAAIRQHYLMGNMILRELPRDEQLAAVPDAWRRETSAEELAMHQVMAGELRFSEGMMRIWDDTALRPLEPGPDAEPPGWYERVTVFLSRPLFKHQDQLNHYAAQYLAMADQFQVPLQRYEAVTEEARASSLQENEWRLYNLMGSILRNIVGGANFSGYPLRVASIEALRRAALVTAELRATGVPASQVPEALRQSELRNPFDLQAFRWSEEEQAVVHEGKEKSSVNRHVYLY